ncbi:ribosomal protein L22/L17 [Dimargaris cristalligena]|uniref:Ribosomal protein L22/L17 n=1 Tax=Dimargaris cristalligena TaxID=215637 RepID=A0A4P9ZUB9_9FUNG|nr:ribosomal protein L22/L17 [Dimargaris cristalligena]|eukprot:RKP37196.1 ribosomal protein L22/L17 [Dimargaris cristalligena]
MATGPPFLAAVATTQSTLFALRGPAVAAQSLHTSSLAAEQKFDPQESRPQLGASPLFDIAKVEVADETKKAPSISNEQPRWKALMGLSDKEYKFSTHNYGTGYKKLRFLAKQISGQPIQKAIDQMEFSPKKWAKPLLSTLALARKNAALQKNLDPSKLVVARTWVGKGRYKPRADFKGRGRCGKIRERESHVQFVLKEVEKERDETNPAFRRNIKRFNMRRRVWTPMKESKPIYRPSPFYNW